MSIHLNIAQPALFTAETMVHYLDDLRKSIKGCQYSKEHSSAITNVIDSLALAIIMPRNPEIEKTAKERLDTIIQSFKALDKLRNSIERCQYSKESSSAITNAIDSLAFAIIIPSNPDTQEKAKERLVTIIYLAEQTKRKELQSHG